MNKNLKRLTSFILSVSLISCYAITKPLIVKAATNVNIDPSIQYQTMDGWGTSLAWWAGQVGGWSDSNRKKIMDLVFGKDGLNLNITRYNIGGGDDPSVIHSHPARFPEGFSPSKEAFYKNEYNWKADANQIKILKEAQNYNIKFNEAQLNSPPFWMTVSGRSSGSITGATDNLKPEQQDNYVNYITDVLKHFKDSENINFKYIDPLNEPNTNYWKAGGGQEGCHFDPITQKIIINKLQASLSKKKLVGTKIVASDETSIDTAISTFNSFDNITKNQINRINTHTYSGSQRVQLRDLALASGKSLEMSEISTGYVADNHDGMDPAIPLVQGIIKDVKEMGVNSWVIWQAVEDEQENLMSLDNGTKWNQAGSWGLIHGVYKDFKLDGKTYTKEQYFVTKQYYAMAQFSRFIKQGYIIIDANNDNVLSAMDPKTGDVVIVATNFTNKAYSTNFDLSRFTELGTKVTPYRTSDTEATLKLSNISIKHKSFKAELPEKSITSFIISGKKYKGGTVKVVNDNVLGILNNNYNYSSDKWGYNNNQIGAYSSDEHYCNTKDNYYEIKFNGNKVKVYGTKSIDSGIAGISIDGGVEQLVDCYSQTRKDNELIFTSLELAKGTHVVKVRVTGNKNINATDCYIVADKSEIVNGILPFENVAPKVSIDSLIGGSQRAVVNFTRVQGATSYNVKYGTSSGKYTTVSTLSSPFVITNLTANTVYYVCVSAIVDGLETANSNELSEKVNAYVSKPLQYYVDCGSTTLNTLPLGEDYGSENSVTDQPYGIDAGTGYAWGYTTNGAPWSSGGSDPYTSVLVDNSVVPGKGITYNFEIPNGDYNIDLGFKDQWGHNFRILDVIINDNTLTTNYNPPNANDIKTYKSIHVTNGSLKIQVVSSLTNKDNPLLSWIKIMQATTN